ncbi:MAG TPA: DUF2384 domain-containing protein [Rhodanobacteraceae bacterium]|nr:DUF2384 domain-containing protein [Rhodanobacteraceae bacterium]
MKAAAAAKKPQGVYARMSALLETPMASETDAIDIVNRGLSTKSFKRLSKRLDIPHRFVASESTVRRRLENNERFTGAEAERVLRLVRVFSEAAELFGDDALALKWMNTPARYLPDAEPITPLQVCSTEPGARLIESHLLRTAHGIF